MCGIAGIYHRDERPIDRLMLDRMTDALAHRGPDGRGVWLDTGVGLGHRRLAIRDLSKGGAQPIASACGRAIVTYNGEIYNDRALGSELELKHGLKRRTSCDAEIIPAGWLAWGFELFHRLEGIYAVALWDKVQNVLVLARDPIGVKPVYTAGDATAAYFASEVKALIACQALGRLSISSADLTSLLDVGYVGPDRSLLVGIDQLPPGTVRVIGRHGSTDHRFWSPKRFTSVTLPDEARDGFVRLFKEVVSDQLVADVPVAVLQSGGVDSSLISLALPTDANVRLFNVGSSNAAFDESHVARELAQIARRPVERLDVESGDAERVFRNVVHALDGALADSSAFATYMLAGRVREHATVALSGDGGDEFFGGYPTYKATALAASLPAILPRPAYRKLAQRLARHGGSEAARIGLIEILTRLCFGLSLEVPHSGWRTYLYPWDRSMLYGPALRNACEQPLAEGYAHAFQSAEGDVWDKSLLADQRYYLPADMLVKVDRTSMAHGLEVRVPFLDRRVMEFAGTLDRSLLTTFLGESKKVLRAAAEHMGAPSSVFAGKKRGFNVPINGLLGSGLYSLADYLLDKGADVLAPFCAPDGVRHIWREHRDGCTDRKYLVWTLLTLAVWREQTGI